MKGRARSRFVAGLMLSGLVVLSGCRTRAEGQAQASPAKSARAHAPLASDPALAAAERAAIAKLPEFRNVLARAEPGTHDYEVEAVVTEGALSERLWLDDVREVAGNFQGSVSANPKLLKSVQRGQQLSVAPEDVVDWAYYDRSRPVGGETRLVAAQQKRAAELAQALAKCEVPKFADSCAVLGERYASGTVGELRLDTAFSLYTKACAGGSAYGCNAAGWAALHGRGGPQDLPAAVDFFLRACPTGEEHPFACDSRGFALLSGLGGTPRDLALAQRLLTQACTRGVAASCLLLELAKAKGLRHGKKLALACEVNLAEQVSRCTGDHDPEACFLAGSAFDTGICGAPRSRVQATELLRGASAFGATWPSPAVR
ncbi:MAG TPA: DUF2314 domain-containing protein [Polyangiaceae bacterium]